MKNLKYIVILTFILSIVFNIYLVKTNIDTYHQYLEHNYSNLVAIELSLENVIENTSNKEYALQEAEKILEIAKAIDYRYEVMFHHTENHFTTLGLCIKNTIEQENLDSETLTKKLKETKKNVIELLKILSTNGQIKFNDIGYIDIDTKNINFKWSKNNIKQFFRNFSDKNEDIYGYEFWTKMSTKVKRY